MVRFLVLFVSLAWLSGGGPPSASAQVKSKPTSATVDEKWLKRVAALPANQQVEEIVLKFKEQALNAGTPPICKIDNGTVTEVTVNCDYIADIGPLCALPGLRKLDCVASSSGSGILKDLTVLKYLKELTHLVCQDNPKVYDLKPLKGLPLVEVRITRCGRVPDLEPLAGDKDLARLEIAGPSDIPSLKPLEKCVNLETLILEWCPVRNLAPLKDKPLKHLDLHIGTVPSLEPLKGMSLQVLCLMTKEPSIPSDITLLKSMPLTDLTFGGFPIKDLAVLTGMNSLRSVGVRISKVKSLQPLENIPLEWLHLVDCPVDDLSPLKHAKLHTLSLVQLPQLTKLHGIEELPLRNLDISSTKVSDLKLLAGKKLTHLNLEDSASIKDIAALHEMPLESLNLNGTQVADLTPLKGTKISSLYCLRTPNVKDFSVLQSLPLTGLRIDPVKLDVKVIKILKAIPTLKTINDKPASDVLK